MTKHTRNISAFVDAAESSSDQIAKAYFGLVAVELVLKEATGLKDHNVPAALNKFAHIYAVDRMRGCKIKIISLSAQLGNALRAINVLGIDGNARSAPPDSYPNIRYTRYLSDGWSEPATSDEQAKVLCDVVSDARAYLTGKFGKVL